MGVCVGGRRSGNSSDMPLWQRDSQKVKWAGLSGLRCQSLSCIALRWFQNSDKNGCKLPYFRLGLTTFCSIQKPQFLFWVQCLSHGGPCYWQLGPWTTWTSSGSSDSRSETLSQTLHFLRFQRTPALGSLGLDAWMSVLYQQFCWELFFCWRQRVKN